MQIKNAQVNGQGAPGVVKGPTGQGNGGVTGITTGGQAIPGGASQPVVPQPTGV